MLFKNLIITFILLTSFSMSAMAQMFTVEETRQRTGPSRTVVFAGLGFSDMSHRSDDGTLTPNYTWSREVYTISAEISGLEAFASFANNITPKSASDNDINYLHVGLRFTGGLPLTGGARAGVSIPVRIGTEFVRTSLNVANQPQADEFRQNSLSIGAGAGAYLNPSQRIRMSVALIPEIGFSYNAFGSDSSTFGLLNGRYRVHFDQLIERFGFSAGYDYMFRRYSAGEERFDYDIHSHSVVFGINF